MHINKYCFSSKNGYQTSICEATSWPFHVRLQEFLIGVGGGGGGGGFGGPYPTFSKSSMYFTVVHQWFISGPTFTREGGGMGAGGLNANFYRNP